MQTRNVDAKEVVPIQKLMTGLPAGHNPSFFNAPKEILHLGAASAAIALFNQAVNSPGISSGLEVGLRKAAVVTLISGTDLRSLIWRNVLHGDATRNIYPNQGDQTQQAPNWIKPLIPNERAENLTLLRGLFWQPKCIELVRAEGAGSCDQTGDYCETLYVGFKWKKQSRKVEGFWNHPHTPSRLRVDGGRRENSYLAFTSARPSWEHCLNFMATSVANGPGNRAAAVVEQWRTDTTVEHLNMLVGGYCRPKSNEEKIVARRHELYSIGEGWRDENGQQNIREAITSGTAAKGALVEQLRFVAEDKRRLELRRKDPRKTAGIPTDRIGEARFYQRTESLMHDWLRTMTRSERKAQTAVLVDQLTDICRDIFEELTDPYCRNPALVRTVALARRGLAAELKKMKEAIAS